MLSNIRTFWCGILGAVPALWCNGNEKLTGFDDDKGRLLSNYINFLENAKYFEMQC